VTISASVIGLGVKRVPINADLEKTGFTTEDTEEDGREMTTGVAEANAASEAFSVPSVSRW
jgi:hypothetical protein